MIGTTLDEPDEAERQAFRSGGTSSETCHSSAAFCIIEPVNDSEQAEPDQPEVAVFQRDERSRQGHVWPRTRCGW